ncbi:hypothetical protein [Flavobacterium sp.]|uniref:hypothetical protein n=1 Tax=Flavobacterium sp. TaxID=239 RepID=UPI0037531347
MKYIDLNIETETFEIYQKVTNLMRVKPFEYVQENNKAIWQQDVKDKYKLWTYKVVNDEEIEHFDFKIISLIY